MLHPLGSSLALAWPDAIKGYGDKYGDNDLNSDSSSDLLLFLVSDFMKYFCCAISHFCKTNRTAAQCDKNS